MKRDLTKTIKDKLLDAAAKQVMDMVKDIPAKLIKAGIKHFRFSLTIPEDSETYFAFEDWFYENHEEKFKDVTVYNFAKDNDGEKKKRSDREAQRSHYGGYRQEDTDFGFGIGYSQNAGTTAIRYNGSKITITKTKTAGDKDQGKKPVQYYTLTGTSKARIKALVEEIYEQYNSDHDQIKVFVSDLYGGWNMVKRIKGKPIDGIILNTEIHTKLVKDLEEFTEDKAWYEKLNIPYKRGYLLYGPPGNGKTSLSIAIASKHKRNIYCLDINKLRDDQTLRYAFQSLQANSLLLIEDIDAAFEKRDAAQKEVASGKKVNTHSITFACLLNCLDGVYYKDGLVTILTTNHLSRLDEALIRPGRMDMRVQINNPTIVEVEAYMSRFYGAKIKLSRYVQELSMAQVQGVCITHKKNMDAAIAEIEADAISVVLNDTVEMLQMIEERDRLVEVATTKRTAIIPTDPEQVKALLALLTSNTNISNSTMGNGAPKLELVKDDGEVSSTPEAVDEEEEDPADSDDEDEDDEDEVDESLPTAADGLR